MHVGDDGIIIAGSGNGGSEEELSEETLTNVGAVPASSNARVVAGHASANTKGAYTQVIASTAADADGFHLLVNNLGGNFDSLIDVALGGAGSEVVLVGNILFSAPSTIAEIGEGQAYIPLPIPAGSRIAVRFQDTVGGGQSIRAAVTLAAGSFYERLACTRATTYGANTADSGGVAVDCGGVAHTKGSWAQIVASLTNPVKSALICLGSSPATLRDDANFLFDLGLGAAASEAVLLGNEYFRSNAGDDKFRPQWRDRHISAGAGERLAARGQSSVTTADNIFDIVVIGFD